MQLGEIALDFNLPGVDGQNYSLQDFSGKQAVAVIFSCNHCPYVKAYEDRLIAVQREYADRDVALVAINANDDSQYPDDSFDNMVTRANQKGFPFPYLRDESQQVAQAYGAQRTPEIFLFDSDLRLRYHGRPDDNWEDPDRVEQPYFRDAIEALLNGEEVPVPKTEPIGCTIKWKMG
ncbi:MAG: thioredoxin family protein [Candidatus Bipolaricaulia bacterium]